jgi:hypothetical protein
MLAVSLFRFIAEMYVLSLFGGVALPKQSRLRTPTAWFGERCLLAARQVFPVRGGTVAGCAGAGAASKARTSKARTGSLGVGRPADKNRYGSWAGPDRQLCAEAKVAASGPGPADWRAAAPSAGEGESGQWRLLSTAARGPPWEGKRVGQESGGEGRE